MGKPRTLADTVRAGGPFENGSGVARSAVISTNGAASYSFTGIAPWVTKVRLLFSGVSVNATASTAAIQVQMVTSAGAVVAGYRSTIHSLDASSVASGSFSSAFLASIAGADANEFSGVMDLSEVAPNVWVESATLRANTTRSHISSGDVSMGSELVGINVFVGVGAFDGGTISVMYE